MAYVNQSWATHLAAMGNRPGDHRGDVTLHLIQPVEGRGEWTLPSDKVTIAAEQGSLVGFELELPGGRRAFVPGGNVAAVIDTADDSGKGD
jgi:hypothetical protein